MSCALQALRDILRPSRSSSTAGFSLVEALVALAVAAFMVAVLTRFVVGIRANALEVRQELVMNVLSSELLERYVTSDLKPGRFDGRAGALAWRIDVAPLSYSARAQSVSEEKTLASAEKQQSAFTLSTAPAPAIGKPKPAIIWNPYHVTVVITSPSGRKYAVDTVRIGQQPAEEGAHDAK